MSFSHRPGSLKQQNKTHKHGKHRSKGQLEESNSGKVSSGGIKSRKGVQECRLVRKNKLKQMTQKKKEAAILVKRNIGGSEGAPQIVALVSLCPDISSSSVKMQLCKSNGVDSFDAAKQPAYIVLPKMRQRLAILDTEREIDSVLNAVQVADIILFCVSSLEEIDEKGRLFMSLIRAQGVPAIAHVVPNISSIQIKSRGDVKKYLLKQAQTNFPIETKIFTLDSSSDCDILTRHLASMKRKILQWRNIRSYMLCDKASFTRSEGSDLGTLQVSGFLRGSGLSSCRLVHLQNFGDFQIEKISSDIEPCPLKSARTLMDQDSRILDQTEPENRDSLQTEVVPDSMDGEQTWPSEEDLKMVDAKENRQISKKMIKRVPKGFSDYQASWILEESEEEEEEDGFSSGFSEDEQDLDDQLEEEKMSVENSAEEYSDRAEEDEEQEEQETVVGDEVDDRYDQEMDLCDEEEKLKTFLSEKKKAAEEDLAFPDEVDTPMNIPARIRFQKYRGLQSFKNSVWGKLENLPIEIARIFKFQDIERTRKRILSEQATVQAGQYVSISIPNVPQSVEKFIQENSWFPVFGVLEHEVKMSLFNCVIKTSSFYEEPIASKEEILVCCGYRRYLNRPIYSQHTNGNKHKYEKFLHEGVSTVASMFAPICYRPCPVLFFKIDEFGEKHFIASGSVINADPDRIVVKKIILSGHPFKIHTRSAVIRFMFFNKQDIEWFRPVELWTKCGRKGHIRQSLGTHGHMKCSFDGPIKNHDTICLSLYKRVFPKWTYRFYSSTLSSGENEEIVKQDSMDEW
eukprot:Sdes_comp20143_c0_seq1m13251